MQLSIAHSYQATHIASHPPLTVAAGVSDGAGVPVDLGVLATVVGTALAANTSVPTLRVESLHGRRGGKVRSAVK